MTKLIESKTFSLFAKYWTGEVPTDGHPMELPFNIEMFCRENDEEIRHLGDAASMLLDENEELRAKLKELEEVIARLVPHPGICIQ